MGAGAGDRRPAGDTTAPTEAERARSPAPAAARSLTGRSVVLVVEPGREAGQPVNGDAESGFEVDEVAEPLGEPGHRDLFFAAPLREFLDAAVGEVHVHQLPWGLAVSMISRWGVACSLAEPLAGAELAGSDTTPTWRPSTRGSFSAMVGQAPMLTSSS